MIKEKKLAVLVVVLYCLLFVATVYFARIFVHNTRLTFAAPKNTIVHDAVQTATIYFPHQLPINPLYLLLTARNLSRSILGDPNFELLCNYLLQQLRNESSPIFGKVNNILGYFAVPEFSPMRDFFIGGDHNQSSLLTLNLAPSVKSDVVMRVVSSVIDAWCNEHTATFTQEYTSTQLVSDDAAAGILGDLLHVDVISLPMAFLVLSYCLGSVRLLLVPFLAFSCTVSIAFGIMYPVSLLLEVSSFAPELTVGVVAALSIDYSLFILTRFREQVRLQEILLGRSPRVEWVVVKNTAILSFDNIFVSGLAVAISVGSLSFMPVTFLSTVGLTMCITVVCAVFVSLTLQPALLLVFCDFFGHPPTWTELWHKLRFCFFVWPCHSYPPHADSLGNASQPIAAMQGQLLPEEEQTCSDHENLEYQRQMSSYWFGLSRYSFRHPWVAIAAVLAFGAPFFYFAAQLQVDFDVFTQIPRGSPHGEVLKRIQRDIGGGLAIPFYILFSVRGVYDVSFWKTDEMTNVMRSVIEAILTRTGQSYSSIISPNMVLDPASGEVVWLKAWESFCLYKLEPNYQYLVNQTVSVLEGKAAYFFLIPPKNPFGASAKKYLNTIMDILREHAANNVLFSFGIFGASSASWAIMSKSMEFFSIQIGVVFGGIFIIMFLVFRSVFLPFRLIFTVVYTVGVSYGVGVIVFQYKWLHPVWRGLEHVEYYCFLIPLLTFLFLCALSLDYDVFLMTRIIEFKKKGYTDEAAVAKAVWKTGSIISFAGIIMFLTIGSMVFSSVMMLSQFAVVCSVAVLLDTFVVRPFFVPALMGIGSGWYVWWPRRFPELRRNVHDMRIDPDANLEEIYVDKEEKQELFPGDAPCSEKSICLENLSVRPHVASRMSNKPQRH
ncbi:MmpL efflux pump [Trypanosoma rangeli]|uniref:MmpL efflux pump n=1 Tax=Trypanosoma rangeli TaxID=5698 RepID=A0A422NJD3_TRYRA|nr:MmpL efflux pump [Trypanosoma rangeli]RNF05524.1 MmpL efflux pump [Trypanosoma rangeli]|eukprot:RNF05524.1 MmpL efflux pump [Trypanosoma rangeli]